MDQNKSLKLTVFSALAIAIFHILAVAFYLYWFYWWFDIPLHFLGGVCVGFFSVWVYLVWNDHGVIQSYGKTFIAALLGVMIVGVAWEVFEYSQGITFNSIGNYPLDTIKDIIVDLTGGCSAYLYMRIKGTKK